VSSASAERAQLLDYLRAIPTGYVTDAFSRLGLSGWLTGLKSISRLGEQKIVGPAVTAWFAPVRGKKQSASLYGFL